MKLFLLGVLFAYTSLSAAQVLDATQEARFAKIAAELRCLVCQNQSIADSHADLAVDLRLQIREQIAAGRSDAEINAYMAQRYGDFVLYRPPFKSNTWLLWLAPLLLLAAGIAALAQHLRGRRVAAEAQPLSEAQHAQALALLEGKPPE